MKNLLLLCALWVLATPLRAVAGPPDIVVVRIYDNGISVNAIITRGEGKSEKVSFEGGHTDKRLVLTSAGYYKLFQRFYQEGYMLQSTFSNSNSSYATLLFVKAPSDPAK